MNSRKRGRPPKLSLMQEVELAYRHLHDRSWLQLQASPLVNLPEVQRRVNRQSTLPGAQALAVTLLEASKQATMNLAMMPDMAHLSTFLIAYLEEGKSVKAIAGQLGKTREWCSRSYRKDALTVACAQFIWLVSSDE